MSKMIAVCGSPNSGKTTVALKIGQEIYSLTKAPVIFLSPDLSVPSMAYLFPNGKDSELFSLGAALDKTDIYVEDVLKETVGSRTMRNFGFLGFKLGENKYSYPRPTEDKVDQLLSVLKDLAEYVIADCTCDEGDLLSSAAKRDCDVAVRLYTPDIKCITYCASCVNQFVTVENKCIKVMNIPDNDVYFPIKESVAHFKDMDHIIPYEREIKKQMITGALSERIGNGKFRSEIEKIAKAVI